MTLRLTSLLLGAFLVVGVGAAAAADGYGGHTNEDDNGLDFSGQQSEGGAPGSEADDAGRDENTSPTSSKPQPWWEHRYVPACGANGVEGGPDALCMNAVSSCPNDGDIRYFDYRRLVQVNGSRGDWENTGTVCRGPDEETGIVQPEITPEMVIERAEALAPVGQVNVEPENRTFVHFPTNVSTEKDGNTVTVHLFGQAIAVTFAPTAYQWDFGDGETATGPGIPGAKINQAGAVEHRYARTGEYDITVTRTFTATFTLPDGEDVTIPGEISTTSDAYTITVNEIQSLVTGVR